MWLKLFSIFLVTGLVQTYINNADPNSFRSGSKSSYLNSELSRFRNRISSTTEKSKSLSWYRNYQNLKSINDHKIRHTNNRFPKMDRLLTRMTNSNLKTENLTDNPFRKYTTTTEYNDVKSENNKRVVQNWMTDSNYKRASTISTTTTTESNEEHEAYFGEDEPENLQSKKNEDATVNQNDNEDLDEDNEEEDDEEEDMDEQTEDEDDEEDESDNWQAEEATEEPTEKTFTEYKWKHFGTRARVEESRKNHGITSSTMRREVQEAVEHARRVQVSGACREPRPRLIRVQHVYPSAGKAYIPHCTLLHRCADDTGCCRSVTLTCAPKHVARVELYFYTGRPGSYSVEKLAFYNHTECHCVERTQEVMSKDAAEERVLEDKYPLKPSSGEITLQTAPEPIKRCRCPELYSAQFSHGQCRCDCSEGNRDCMRIKKGKEYFSLKDRLCIQKGECGYPACEFGVYIRQTGRCPRKQEKIEAFSRISPQ